MMTARASRAVALPGGQSREVHSVGDFLAGFICPIPVNGAVVHDRGIVLPQRQDLAAGNGEDLDLHKIVRDVGEQVRNLRELLNGFG